MACEWECGNLQVSAPTQAVKKSLSVIEHVARFQVQYLGCNFQLENKEKKREIFFMLDNKVTEWETSEMTRSDNHNTARSVKMKYFNWWLDDSFLQS